MTTRSCLDKLHRSGALLTMAAALVMATPAFAQSNVATTTQEGRYYLVDVSPFFGTQYFQIFQGPAARPLVFRSGIMVGIRVDENVSRYFSLEQGFSMGFNQAQFLPVGFVQPNRVVTTEHNYQLSLLGVMHFTPRDKPIRPYVELGAAATFFNSSYFNQSNASVIYPNIQLQRNIEPGLVYGIGFKSEVSRYIGVRVDLRSVWGEQPHFGITSVPGVTGSIYVPAHGTFSSLQFTSAIVFHFDAHEPPPPPVQALRLRRLRRPWLTRQFQPLPARMMYAPATTSVCRSLPAAGFRIRLQPISGMSVIRQQPEPVVRLSRSRRPVVPAPARFA